MCVADINAIKDIIANIRERRSLWKISPRKKNYDCLMVLGIDSTIALDEIYHKLTWDCYVSGPTPDNHIPSRPGDIWVFGLDINQQECYLKFQDKPTGIVMWISIHQSKYPLNYPYR